jgi:hypothetical protein
MLMLSGVGMVGMVDMEEWEDMEDTVDTVAATVDTAEDGVDIVTTTTAADGMAVNSTAATRRMFNQSLTYKIMAIKPFNMLFLHKFQK